MPMFGMLSCKMRLPPAHTGHKRSSAIHPWIPSSCIVGTLSPPGALDPPRGTYNAAAGNPWMDRWMDGGGTFMASVSRGQSHFAREHSKRWHTKNPRCLATWANFSCFWLILLITIGPKPFWTRILHFLYPSEIAVVMFLAVKFFFYSST